MNDLVIQIPIDGFDPDNTSSHCVLFQHYYDTNIIEHLNDLRREYAQNREEMLTLQKECGKRKDFEGAKFFKEEASYWLKMYRAACLCIGKIDPTFSGDSPWVDFRNFPLEIEPHTWTVYGLASLRVKPG